MKASRFFVRLLLVSIALAAALREAAAHPYLQGKATIVVGPNRITVELTVAIADACIANVLLVDLEKGSYPVEPLRAAVRKHGQYVLERFGLIVGPNESLKMLQGRIVRIEEPSYDKPIYPTEIEMICVTYHLEYDLESPVERLLLVHQLMSDFQETPGTPWVETLVVSIRKTDEREAEQFLLQPTVSKEMTFSINGTVVHLSPRGTEIQPPAANGVSAEGESEPASVRKIVVKVAAIAVLWIVLLLRRRHAPRPATS